MSGLVAQAAVQLQLLAALSLTDAMSGLLAPPASASAISLAFAWYVCSV